MDGRPGRPQTDVRLVRRTQPGARRSHTLPPAIAIVVVSVFVAALFTRATGSAASPIGPQDARVVSIADPSAKAASSAPHATSIAVLSTSSPATNMPPLPTCRYADELAAHAAYDDWQHTIVDTTSRLPKGYVPPELVPVSRAGLSGGGSIRRIAIPDLRALAKAARKARVRLAVESAYRSEAQQHRTFAGWVRTSGEAEARRFSARPGHSEHQLGTAIDFKTAGGGSPWTRAFARSRHARWLAANAWRFGWIQSYPPDTETQTCYGAEAWHYRYVGRNVAAEVHASGMTLRAWLWLHGADLIPR
jgi:D-alanyl-D-alanine carboxypeptidase